MPTTFIWNGPAGGLASVAANWLPVAVPVIGDEVIFNSTANTNCTWDLTVLLAIFTVAPGYNQTITTFDSNFNIRSSSAMSVTSPCTFGLKRNSFIQPESGSTVLFDAGASIITIKDATGGSGVNPALALSDTTNPVVKNCLFQNIELQVGAITGLGLIQFSRFTGTGIGIDITVGFVDGALTIEDCVFVLKSFGVFVRSSNTTDVVIRHCRFQRGLSVDINLFGVFNGIIEQCFAIDGNQSLFVQKTPGSNARIRDNTFIADTWDVFAFSGSQVQLYNCVLNTVPKVAGNDGATKWQVISYLHERANNKIVWIFNDLTVDGSFTSVIHADSFNWDGVDWDIEQINNEFKATSGPLELFTDFIPIEESVLYFFSYDGTSTFANIEFYDINQVLLSTSVNFVNTLIVTSDATAVFCKFKIRAAIADETASNLEIRESDSSGQLIFQDDLVNHFLWADDWNFDGFTLRSAGSGIPNPIIYGDIDIKSADIQTTVTNISSITTGGKIFGYQDSDNFYEVVFDDSPTTRLVVNRIVNSVVTELDFATRAQSGTPLFNASNTHDLLIQWNPEGGDPGTIVVFVDGDLIFPSGAGSSGWQIETVNPFVTDDTFTNGKLGFSAKGGPVIFDNMVISHTGMFLRDVDLKLGSNVDVFVPSDGTWSFKRGTVNATLSFFHDQGGQVENESIIWADKDFDESVTGIVSYKDVKLEVTKDIELGPNAQLTIIGCIINHVDPKAFWTIKTPVNSVVKEPIIIKQSTLLNLNVYILPLDSGVPLEISQEALGPEEEGTWVDMGGNDEQSLHASVHQIWGSRSDLIQPKGMSAREVNIRFNSYNTMGFPGHLRCLYEAQTRVLIVWPGGGMSSALITDLFGGARMEGNALFSQYTATFTAQVP